MPETRNPETSRPARRRATSLLASLALAAGLLAATGATASPASADVTDRASADRTSAARASGLCNREQSGDRRQLVGRPVKTWILTSSAYEELDRRTKKTIRLEVTKTTTKEMRVNFKHEASAKVEIASFIGAEQKLGLELGAAFTKVHQRKRIETQQADGPGEFWLVAGFVHIRVPTTLQICGRRNIADRGYYWQNLNTGTLHSWDTANGMINCRDRQTPGSFGEFVKARKC